MSSLSHHGIKGQRWGVRRFQNKDGTLTREGQIRFAKNNLKHAKVRNLDKWGKSPDSNVLYIIGTSGSGKSTTAKGLADDGDQVIHLDTIFEKENHGSPDSNKDFEAFLKENNVDISKASDFSIPREERWKTYDAIGDLVETYGQHCFSKGSKVVIEGVQMGDQTLYPDKNYFNGKPTVVLKGNIVRDTFRADRRDGVPLRKTVVRLTDKERWNWYKQVNSTSNEIKYTSIDDSTPYLVHHGILGQKWGVRRFQNKDGTRTAAGKKHVSETMLRKRNLIEAGRASLDQKLSTNGGTYINNVSGLSGKGLGTISNVDKHTARLSKGSVLNRFATKDEPLDSHRKYVSFTEKDKATYERTIKGHGLQAKWDSLDDLMLYSYEATKDIKIANGRRIEQYITNDLKAKPDYKTNWTAKNIVKAISHHVDNAYIVEGYFNEKANGDWAKKTPEDRKADYKIVLNAMAENGMYSDTMKYYMTGFGTNTFDKMSSTLRKEGYDAIVDMFDARSLNQVEEHDGGLADYPMAILDPKSSLRLKETRKLQYTSIGGTMYIEGNALIFGDSSYLEHHGILGQKWGVRRFQNADGSLTNAGRKRLGYATKGATQAVKKAFNAGVKTGAKAVKAAKAHHEKAEAKKIEKKKEKASKTRAGVYANKDLFTAKELKDLNAKFEEQDKLAMARLKKGVEIAKAVGQYAQTAKQIGDAYQSITGKNILSHITEIKSANEAKAKEEKEAADKAKAEAEAAAKKAESKAMAKEALQKNIDAFKADQESNARVKDLEKQGNKTAAKTKLAEYIDRYNQDKAAQEQTKQMMKNQKLQEYIDRANQAQREKDSATFKETTDRGKQVIDLLQRHSTDSDLFKEDYQNRVTNAGNSTKPSSVPDDSNLIGLVRKANASNSLSTNSTSRSKDSDDLMAKNREAKAAGDIKDASERASKAIGLLGRKDRITNGNSNDNEPTSVSTPSMNDLAKLIRAANSANSKSGPTIEKSQWQRDLEERTRQLKSDDDNRKLANNLDSIKKAASDASKAANSKSNDPSETTQKLLTNNAKKLDNGKREIGGVFEKALMKKEQRAPNLQKLEAAQKKWKSSSDPSLRKKYMKIVSEELQYLSDDEFDLYMAGKLFKHSAFSDPDFIEHYGVRGMKWGKHLMAGKGSGIYDGTALGSGGGGGPMTEEERKKAEELRKKKLEEAKKKAEEAAKEKEIEKKAKELGISVEAYKRYSIENNHLPGRHHYDKSQKLHGEASSSLAEAQAAERQAHMNRAKAASLMRKVNSSHMFDADGYHISRQRGDDRKEAKRLQKEAKQLDKKSKKALKKSYKKRYKSDKERQKWQNSTSGKYHHMMRHYEIQNGVLFINAGEPYLEHHGVKGMKWGKHLMAGKGVDAEGGGGGGFAEDDEKLKEMAKKAGMTVAEYRTKMTSKLGGAAAKAKKEIGYAYGSEYKKDFEKSARLHENNSRSMREQAKAAWEGYGESRTAAQKDNWKRYAEYDRQAKASGNMFVKRERSKQAYDNSLASKVDSVKRKARLTQDKAKSKISDAVDAAKKTRDDVKDNIRSKTGIGVKKDIEHNARLAEGQKRRAHELTKQVYAAKNKDDWARAYSESNKESFKALDNEHKVNKDAKSYPKSIAGRVDSAKRKARLTKDRLKSALGKSKQRKQLSTEGPKAKKKVRIESASAMGFSTNNPYSIPVDARRWGHNATNKSRVSVGKRGDNMPKTALNPKHTDTSHRRKSVGEVMNNAKNPTPGNTPIQSPTQYARANRPRGREKYYKLGQESKGVKKRSRRVKHFDGSDELYTEGTRLVVNSKWG